MTDAQTFSCSILSLAVYAPGPFDGDALKLARRFSQSAESFLVEPSASEQVGGASQAPMRPSESLKLPLTGRSDFKTRSLETALAHIQAATADHIILLNQPDHPIDRQTPSFQRLSAAALQTSALVIFVPKLRNPDGGVLIVDTAETTTHAESLFAGRLQDLGTQLATLRKTETSLERLADWLLQLPSTHGPSMIVIQKGSFAERPGQLMKLAALARTAILVLEPPLTENES